MKQKTYEAIYDLNLNMDKKKKEIESNQQKIEVAERRSLVYNVLILKDLIKIGHQLDNEKEQLLR